MDKITQQIEEKYAVQLQEAENALNAQQQLVNQLREQKEQELKEHKEYAEAIATKMRVDSIIASTRASVKSEVNTILKI